MKVGLLNINPLTCSKEEQLRALQEAGCERIFEMGTTVSAIDRSELEECLESLQVGDTLVVWRMDVLEKSLNDLVQLLTELADRHIAFSSLEDHLHTRGLMGQMVRKLLVTLKKADRQVQRIRMQQVRRAAYEKGVRMGRKTGSVNRKNREKPMQCKQLYENGSSVTQIMTLLNIRSANTVYRYLRQLGVQLGDFKERRNLTKQELTAMKRNLFDEHHQLNLFDQ
ncbi:MAG: recombinase family protein [Bacteroidaceae bacterium]|jgi:DNA invertase Pin-like site-specific DNA recombinase|nr:recombinase family protein [Bacteroidaceae bacterium]MBQ9500395.1 recombinase family protein [Bacteroidaceae bacterium]